MAKVQRYWPMALSGICLAAALYFAFTNTAYVREGCPIEVYPELGFAFIVAPVAVVALILATKVARPAAAARSRRPFVASVALSFLCLAYTAVLLWPTGSICH